MRKMDFVELRGRSSVRPVVMVFRESRHLLEHATIFACPRRFCDAEDLEQQPSHLGDVGFDRILLNREDLTLFFLSLGGDLGDNYGT